MVKSYCFMHEIFNAVDPSNTVEDVFVKTQHNTLHLSQIIEKTDENIAGATEEVKNKQ